MAHYLDTSALVKLVATESESAALRRWIDAHARDQLVTSDLTRTELMRATRRLSEAVVPTAAAVLDVLAVVALTPATFQAAGLLAPPELRSLDALHLAAALALGDDLDSFITYDRQLATAASSAGLVALAPGVDAA